MIKAAQDERALQKSAQEHAHAQVYINPKTLDNR